MITTQAVRAENQAGALLPWLNRPLTMTTKEATYAVA